MHGCIERTTNTATPFENELGGVVSLISPRRTLRRENVQEREQVWLFFITITGLLFVLFLSNKR